MRGKQLLTKLNSLEVGTPCNIKLSEKLDRKLCLFGGIDTDGTYMFLDMSNPFKLSGGYICRASVSITFTDIDPITLTQLVQKYNLSTCNK